MLSQQSENKISDQECTQYSITDSETYKTKISELDLKQEFDTTQSRYGPPTDGGYGWVVVGASFFVLLFAFGNLFVFGTFLQHYTTTEFRTKSNLTTLSAIGTLASGSVTMLALITGRLADRLGYRTCIWLGGTIFALGFLLASFATEVWHLFVTQGLMVGIGASISFVPAMSAPAQWFDKRRGLATGIAISGAGVGGLILSPIIQLLIEVLNVKWALRIISIVSFLVISAAGFLIRERTEPNKNNKSKNAKFIDLSSFKDTKFVCFFMAGVASSFGYLVPFYLMSNYAVSVGLTASQGSLLIGLLNGGSSLGRVLTGHAADKFGKLNVLLACVTMTFLSCFVIWPLSTSLPPLVLFVVLYGFSAGGYAALTPTIIAGLFGLDNLASLVGVITFGNGIPNLIGTPIASAILNSTKNAEGISNYLPVILYAGAAFLVGATFLIRLRFIVSKKVFEKV